VVVELVKRRLFARRGVFG
jgi:hypothetical protein